LDRAGRLRILCANCAIAQFALRIKTYFFKVAQFALRIYKAICVFAICALKNDYLPKCCNSAFVKVIVLKENVKKNRKKKVLRKSVITPYPFIMHSCKKNGSRGLTPEKFRVFA